MTQAFPNIDRPEFPEDLRVRLVASAQELTALLRESFDKGYEVGLRDGGSKMVATILRAVEAPVAADKFASERAAALASLRVQRSASGSERLVRAPRGSVRSAIKAALTKHGALTEYELGQAATELDPSVSPRSMGGELRRMLGRLYRLDGGKWSLIAKREKDPAGLDLSPAESSPPAAQEEPDGTDNNAVAL